MKNYSIYRVKILNKMNKAKKSPKNLGKVILFAYICTSF